MAPAASASVLSAAASKRPAASDAEPPLELDSSTAAKTLQPKQQQQQLECPRCQSTNTKFCYYNNYSQAQPRHFCRACRRYWTHGGTLRDVPVGGASRRAGGGKRRRVSAEAPSSSASSPPPETARAEDACLPGLSAFTFLGDGSFLPQFDLDLGASQAAALFSSSWHSPVPDLYDGLAPWDVGAVGAGAWGGDIHGLDLTWAPPGN